MKLEDLKTLHTLERQCRTLELSNQSETIWSTLFSWYTLNVGDKDDARLFNQEVYNGTEIDNKHVKNPYDIFTSLFFPISFAIFFCVSVVIIPILGSLAFCLLDVIWYLITHPQIRRAGRRILITIEKIKRLRQKMLIPEGVQIPHENQFFLPKFLRIHDGDDIPDELDESEDDDDVWLTQNLYSEDDDSEQEELGTSFKVGVSLSGLQINDPDTYIEETQKHK